MLLQDRFRTVQSRFYPFNLLDLPGNAGQALGQTQHETRLTSCQAAALFVILAMRGKFIRQLEASQTLVDGRHADLDQPSLQDCVCVGDGGASQTGSK